MVLKTPRLPKLDTLLRIRADLALYRRPGEWIANPSSTGVGDGGAWALHADSYARARKRLHRNGAVVVRRSQWSDSAAIGKTLQEGSARNQEGRRRYETPLSRADALLQECGA